MNPNDSPLIRPFDHIPRTRIVFGPGAVEQIGALAQSLNPTRILLVTDQGLVSCGHAARVEASLAQAGLEFTRFDQVSRNPTNTDVETCLSAALRCQPDLLIGLGGGSSIDTAKGCSFLLTNGGSMEDYFGVGQAKLPLLPLIAIPTTAGTGTEVQSFALIERDSDHQKMACGAPGAAPRIALLDPELTLTLTPELTAATGLDTLTHAVESFVSKKRNALSSLYAREAFRLSIEHLPRVLNDPGDLQSRGALMQSSAFAGLAIENSMLGAAHALANPLTAHYKIAHGEAVATMLPHVVRFNGSEPATAHLYTELLCSAGLCPAGTSSKEAVQLLVERLQELLLTSGFAAGPGRHGVTEAALDKLADEAASQWTAQFNPRAVTATVLRELYLRALCNS